MKVVMFDEVAPDGIAKARANFPAHRARLDELKGVVGKWSLKDWNEVLG